MTFLLSSKLVKNNLEHFKNCVKIFTLLAVFGYLCFQHSR